MGAFDAYIRLDGSLKGAVSVNEPMSRHTTYRIGGPADLYVECRSFGDLSLVCDVLAEEEVPWTVIGRGSNLLVSDEGYRGCIIVLAGQFARITVDESAEQAEVGTEVLLTAGAAAPLSTLVQKAFGLSLEGLGFAVGTPGTLGGAVRGNAGTGDEWISSIIDSVTVYTPGKGLSILHGDEIAWGYRSSSIAADQIVVEATLRLRKSDKMMLQAKMEARLKRRKANQPLNMPSCGSVFTNPVGGESAARIIEGCGLKGHVIGGAQISDKHANFIVNNGSATAADVLALIKLVRQTVMESRGIEMKPEVKFIGFEQ